MGDILRVENLSIRFKTPAGPLDALKTVSFRVREASTVAIVGESGSGKSVAAQAIMGILPNNASITSGKILLADSASPGGYLDLAQVPAASPVYRAVRGGRISIIFQEPMTSLSPLHTIGNQITEAINLHCDCTAKQAYNRSVDMLKMVRFPDPERAFKSYPFELSGGLRQRAMIAMSLVCGPGLLIADEPTTALDVTVQAQILGLIADLQKELDMAVMMITHDMGVVANIADEVVVVYHGEVMESGMATDLFSNPRHPYLQALLKAVPRFDGDPSEKLMPLRAVDAKPGKLLSQNKIVLPETTSPLLSVKNLRKNFDIRNDNKWFSRNSKQTVTAVDRVSFDVMKGECLALVGESGCGKTTVSKLIMRAMDADEGEVIFYHQGQPENLSCLDEKMMKPYRKKIQYMFQDPNGSLNPRMTVFEILSEPLLLHDVGDDAFRREMVTELMDVVGLDPRHLNRYPHSFSGGQRQRIGIARALALKPELVICDEPVSALDVSVQAQVLNLLKDLSREMGLTYLFISHDLAVVNYIADRIAVMCRGRLVEIAPRDQLFENPQHPYTKMLLAAVPTTDPDRKLDFKALENTPMNDPENWPDPFHFANQEMPMMKELEHQHFVRSHGRSS